jgi:hypothetical protein
VLTNEFHLLGGAFKTKVLLTTEAELVGYVLACTEAGVHVDKRSIAIVAELVYLGCLLGKLAIFESGEL